jgi:DNA-binding SARP family transcriptional activator
LEIRCLGGFHVLRHGRAIALTEWQSKKARDLLKMLLARRGRPVPRDVLMESLWPGEDPAVVGNRLSVALSVLRAVLDPEKRFGPEQYVRGDRSAVSLDISRLSLDVETFLRDAAAAVALRSEGKLADADELLAAAESTYTGDFLEEDAYQDWAVSLREEARALYITVVHDLAAAAFKANDPELALTYCLRILERDPYDERAHGSLVAALSAAGRHGEARRSYQRYVARMSEIDVEPVPFLAASRPAAPARG